jgi:hypothetical protein
LTLPVVVFMPKLFFTTAHASQVREREWPGSNGCCGIDVVSSVHSMSTLLTDIGSPGFFFGEVLVHVGAPGSATLDEQISVSQDVEVVEIQISTSWTPLS